MITEAVTVGGVTNHAGWDGIYKGHIPDWLLVNWLIGA